MKPPHAHVWQVAWTNGYRWLYRCLGCPEIGYGVPR